MSLMSRVKIGLRVQVGFGTVLGLLSLVAWLGVSSLGGAGQAMTNYERVSGNANRVARIMAMVCELRRNVMRFSQEGDKLSLQRIDEAKAELNVLLPEAVAIAKDPKRPGNLKNDARFFRRIHSPVRAAAKPLRKKKTLVAELGGYGLEASKILTEISKEAQASGEMDLAIAAGNAQEALMLGRISALRFIDQAKEEDAKAVRERLAGFVDLVENLEGKAHSSAQKKRAQDVIALGKKYEGGFGELIAVSTEMRDLVSVKLGDLGAKFRAVAHETLKLQEEQLVKIKEQTFEEIEASQDQALWLSLFALLMGVALATIIGRGITRPILGMTDAMRQLADGDKTVEIPSRENKDEIGTMAKAVEVFKENMIANERLQKEQEEQKARTEEERKAAMREMADSFEAQVGGVIETVTSAATELQAAAKQMSGTAEETSAKATAVAASAEESSSNVQSVASASEELATSIREIAGQVTRTKEVAVKADEQASHASKLIQNLAEHVTGIGEIVSMINEIAAQTNLLALNATIEAARAGGRGQGLCRSGVGGQESGQPDRQGNRRSRGTHFFDSRWNRRGR